MRGSGLTAHGLDFVGDEPKLDLDGLLHRPHECFGRPPTARVAPGGHGGWLGGAVGVQAASNSSTKAKSFQSRISAFSLASAVRLE